MLKSQQSEVVVDGTFVDHRGFFAESYDHPGRGVYRKATYVGYFVLFVTSQFRRQPVSLSTLIRVLANLVGRRLSHSYNWHLVHQS